MTQPLMTTTTEGDFHDDAVTEETAPEEKTVQSNKVITLKEG